VKRAYRISVPVLFPLFLLAACAVGSQLTVPGDLSRPEKAAKSPAGAPQVVVLDFEYSTQEPGVVGRDFDQVRPIEWGGKPGKAMADLVAGILAESGVGVVRSAVDGPALGTALVRVSGQVRRFEVTVRRRGGLKVLTEAAVSLTVTATGGSLSAPVSFTATSTNSVEEIFVTTDGLRGVLVSSANTAAEEAARRILEAGAVGPPPSGK
jgi:hypothetical protein